MIWRWISIDAHLYQASYPQTGEFRGIAHWPLFHVGTYRCLHALGRLTIRIRLRRYWGGPHAVVLLRALLLDAMSYG